MSSYICLLIWPYTIAFKKLETLLVKFQGKQDFINNKIDNLSSKIDKLCSKIDQLIYKIDSVLNRVDQHSINSTNLEAIVSQPLIDTSNDTNLIGIDHGTYIQEPIQESVVFLPTQPIVHTIVPQGKRQDLNRNIIISMTNHNLFHLLLMIK